MRELGACLAAAAPRIAVLDRRRKLEAAARLQQRWQRWELSNFDYLMQACPHPPDQGDRTPHVKAIKANPTIVRATARSSPRIMCRGCSRSVVCADVQSRSARPSAVRAPSPSFAVQCNAAPEEQTG